MNLHFVDDDAGIVTALEKEFARFPEVTVQCADILSVAGHCIVSPANSHGFMDGGIDAVYREFFGATIEQKVREAVIRRPEGHLPVGAAMIIGTGHPRIPWLIIAPTMEMPEAVESGNCYRAMRAILRVAQLEAGIGQDVYCPGLGTGVGRVPAHEAAAKMAEAYGDWKTACEGF